MPYRLEGSILEVCNCQVLCPCWIGEDPDQGTCDSVLAYHFDRGDINGVDVSGLTLAFVAHIPGNVLDGGFRVVIVVDDRASIEEEAALITAFRGRLGGPLEDMSRLIGEVLAVERAPITYAVAQGKGRLAIGESVEADIEPYRSRSGEVTTLNESIFSTIPGSPAYVSKATRWRATEPRLGWEIDLKDHNAIQGSFRFEG